MKTYIKPDSSRFAQWTAVFCVVVKLPQMISAVLFCRTLKLPWNISSFKAIKFLLDVLSLNITSLLGMPTVFIVLGSLHFLRLMSQCCHENVIKWQRKSEPIQSRDRKGTNSNC